MATMKDIQRRIKSVGNTKKITKAMEMVAAAKMRRAIEAVLRTRSYANLSWQTVLNLSQARNIHHPLMGERSSRPKAKQKIGIVLFASNRGLCGSFNTTIINKAQSVIMNFSPLLISPREEVEFIIIGRKGLTLNRYFGYKIVAEFTKADIASEVKEILPLAKMVIEDYLAGKYSQVFVAYTDYFNATKQVPRLKKLLPVEIAEQDAYLGAIGGKSGSDLGDEFTAQHKQSLSDNNQFSDNVFSRDEQPVYEYIFEPSPSEVLDEMLPRLIEIQLFQALLESNASEHSARMTAMRQATDAATDMVNELTLFYNKARQASITSEIIEIFSAANALAG